MNHIPYKVGTFLFEGLVKAAEVVVVNRVVLEDELINDHGDEAAVNTELNNEAVQVKLQQLQKIMRLERVP